MIDSKHKFLSVRKQALLLDVNRATIYYKGISDTESDTILANRIHDLWLEIPVYGYRRITAQLNRDGYVMNHKRVLRLMREMNIQAVYLKPTTSQTDKTNQPFPYLLKDLEITHPNQVWATDITYIKLPHIGFVYLTALIDVYSRYIIGYSISNTMQVDCCMDMLSRAIHLYGTPHIINTDQGSQYTSHIWVSTLQNQNIQISMDGIGRWADNIYIERFWRTYKHESLNLFGINTLSELRSHAIGFFDFYNNRRLHQSLDYHTPFEAYSGLYKAPVLTHFSHKRTYGSSQKADNLCHKEGRRCVAFTI